MDKYLIKNPIKVKPNEDISFRKPKTKQTTLESLAGVVVIEDILRSKNILELKEQSVDEIISTLLSLKEKNPSKEILQSTGIGKTVHRLCRHGSKDVAVSARSVYEKWKTSVIDKATKPMIVVKSDLKTESFRLTARKWLLKSLLEELTDDFAELIEREVFQFHKRLVNGNYRKSIRRIVFALKNDKLLGNKLLNREITSHTLAATYCKL
uniref:TFIIS N-terminal domain-containing protein n=1 Tax=Strigamia maritima TaxID=126957 RepID=T1IKV5_STRMM